MILDQPLRAATLCAVGLVAIDVAVLVTIGLVGVLTTSPVRSAIDIWAQLHWPAFSVAEVLLPRPQSMHDSIPVGAIIALFSLMLVQTAAMGACLGYLLAMARRRRHAL